LEIAVERGPHVVRLHADGYYDEQVDVSAVQDELVARHVTLRPKPAKLLVTGTVGARVAIDGQVRATVPTAAPLAIEPGARFVAVTLPGRKPYSALIDLARDETRSIAVDLPPT